MVQELTMMEVLADIFTFNEWNILNICNNIQNIYNSIMPKKVAANLPSLEVEVEEALTSRLSILHPALSSALGG